ncbi:MAG: 3-oxoacyl-ACP reductase FabG [Solirubrobacterales bacterium]|nr:3-oxoacyl-ACP reductase FabG [Solirubrobacterales bacterium]
MSGSTDAAAGTALVTGASRGIGAAVAHALAAEGRPVAVNYRTDREGADAVVAAIGEAGGSARAFGADVSDAAAVDAMFTEVEAWAGPVLVLVNNAGKRADELFPSMSLAQFDEVLDLNLRGPYLCIHRALMPMIRARHGRIVNVSSVGAARCLPGQANYAASKAGLEALTRTVAIETARRGVTVNAIVPGFVATELTRDVGEAFHAAVPARRAGTAEEVAACVRFLASDAAAYVTGTTLVVDGGLSAALLPVHRLA